MKSPATLALAFFLTAGFAGAALADQPGADWITKEQLVQKLEAAGYGNLTELEADDGHWEGEGVKNGVRTEFHADPVTGALLSENAKSRNAEDDGDDD